MFLPPVMTLDFLGYDFVLMETGDALITGTWYLFLVFAVMFLANRPQPKPDVAAWSADRRRQ